MDGRCTIDGCEEIARGCDYCGYCDGHCMINCVSGVSDLDLDDEGVEDASLQFGAAALSLG